MGARGIGCSARLGHSGTKIFKVVFQRGAPAPEGKEPVPWPLRLQTTDPV